MVLIELAPVHPERGESPPRLPERAELAAIRARAATFGATLEPLAEGALIAVLRGSEDATDLCARAARCALALKRRVPAGSVLAVATGRAEVRGKVLVGEVVERAAQVLAIRSESEGIRLDDVSAGLLDASFVQREGPSFSLLVDYRPEPGTLRTMLGRETPCVGRTREIAALLGAFDECVDERSPRVALVTGAAGVGKSRLRHEVAQALARHPRGPKLWLSRGDPVGGDSAFRLLLELARAAGDAESVSALMRQDEPHSAWRDPQVRAQRIHEAWEALLRAECSQAPLVVMLDDLSWCDAASLACLDDALRNLEGSPLLVLAFGRVDVHERFPGLWQKRALLELGLGPLSTRAQIQLATLLLGPDADPAVAPHIAALAAGNAFYLEELVRAVVSGRGDTLPDTVLAMAQSRFAALPGSDRRLLRAASIFGGPFWPEGLRCLLGADARPAEIERELERLCHDEVLQRDRDSAMPSSTQWSFPQALLREAAYHALTEDDRLLGHRLAAEWLESVGVEDPAVLAHHWAHAGEHERARGAFVAAAWTAFAAGDPRVVRRFAERALTEGARDELMGEACFLLGAAARWKGDLEHSLELHERSLELLPRAGDLWRAAALRVAATAAALGRRARFLELAEVLAGGPVSPDDPPSIAIAALLGGSASRVETSRSLTAASNTSTASMSGRLRPATRPRPHGSWRPGRAAPEPAAIWRISWRTRNAPFSSSSSRRRRSAPASCGSSPRMQRCRSATGSSPASTSSTPFRQRAATRSRTWKPCVGPTWAWCSRAAATPMPGSLSWELPSICSRASAIGAARAVLAPIAPRSSSSWVKTARPAPTRRAPTSSCGSRPPCGRSRSPSAPAPSCAWAGSTRPVSAPKKLGPSPKPITPPRPRAGRWRRWRWWMPTR